MQPLRGRLTNDRLYESKLSREMLNGSVSARRLLWLEDVVETFDLECQNEGFSCCGDGWYSVNTLLVCDSPFGALRS